MATAKVTTALGKMRAGINSFANSANEKLGSVAKMVAFGLTAAFVGLAKKAIDLGSELSDIATSTGFATEQFQVFRGALIDAGGKAGAMEKSIINMQKAVIQGSEGLTTYTRAFERLGLKVEDIIALPVEKQFEEIGKAVAGAEDRQKAFISALEIFGTKNAPRLIEVFERLRKDGYGKMASDIEETYGIMDESTQKSLDKAADNIERFKTKATIKVGELISGEANFASLKALGARFGAMMAQVGEWMANGFLFALKELAAGMAATTAVWHTNMSKAAMMVGLTLFDAIAPVINKLANLIKLTPAGLLIDVDKFKVDTDKIKQQIDNISFNKPIDDFNKFRDVAKGAMGDWKVSTKTAQDAFIALAEIEESKARTFGIVAKSQEERAKNAEDEAMRAAIIAKAAKEQAEAEALIAEEVRLQAELKEAIARGDLEAVKVIEDALKMEKEIKKIIDDTKVSREQATKHVIALRGEEQKLADEKSAQLEKEEAEAAKEEAQATKMLAMEQDLIMAQADGNAALAKELQGRIDKEKEALDIMDKFGFSIEKARGIAAKLAGINAGPDANNSGFVTRKEQRAFDKKQKALAKEEKKRNRAEEAAERNVSAERRKGTGLAAIAARNKELEEQRQIKKAGEQALRDWKKLGGDAPMMFDLEGNPIGPDGKPIGPNGQPLDPNGKPLPVEPKKPANAVVDGLKPTLVDIKAELVKIEKHLQC